MPITSTRKSKKALALPEIFKILLKLSGILLA